MKQKYANQLAHRIFIRIKAFSSHHANQDKNRTETLFKWMMAWWYTGDIKPFGLKFPDWLTPTSGGRCSQKWVTDMPFRALTAVSPPSRMYGLL